MTTAAPPSAAPGSEIADIGEAMPPRAADDLREIIEAYHGVTERLQHSHEALQREVHRLREQLASADAQLQRSKRLAALGEMAAGIAHEVRNPLAAIGLYAEMIAEDSVVARASSSRSGANVAPGLEAVVTGIADNAEKIRGAVRGLSGVVNDVLSFSRRVEPKRSDVAVSALFSRVIEAHRPELERAGIEIVAADGGLGLPCDADLMHQALLNLVRNAVSAMAEHAESEISPPPHRLTLDAQVDPDDNALLRLTVADTGPGLDAGAVDRIFNPFFTTRSTGTGLGLAIVHRIVDAHGGAIAVHNDPKTGGAVFTLTLPKEPA